MLECGGVENEFRPMLREYPHQLFTLADRAENRGTRYARVILAHLEVDFVEVELAGIEQNQMLRRERRDLPNELASNRTAGSRYENPASRDRRFDRLAVEPDLRPPEQLGNIDEAQDPASRSSSACSW